MGKLTDNSGRSPAGLLALGGYIALYSAALYGMHSSAGFDVAEPLLVFGILGIGYSLMAWLLTLRAQPLPYRVEEPELELIALGTYLLPLIAFVTWGFGFLRHIFPADPIQAIVILVAKLLVFVVLPAVAIQTRFPYGARRLAPSSGTGRHMLAMAGMCLLVFAFQAVLGRGLRDIADAHLSAPALLLGLPVAFVLLALEVGVVEEFFFRVLLQTRLAAVLKSELAGIVGASLIFGLVHAPGLYLRTAVTQEGLPAHPSFPMAVGYSIVITSVGGFFLGTLWSRTRNFAVIVVVHAIGDLLPDLLPTLHSFRLL